MEKLGRSTVTARGQLTLAADVRRRFGIKEDDVLDWFLAKPAEIAGFSDDQILLLAVPMRAQVLTPKLEGQLKEAIEAFREKQTISVAELVGETANKE